MQQKLCLWMAMVVLFGALCVGNPFLACRDGTSPVEPTTAAASSAERVDPAVVVATPRANELATVSPLPLAPLPVATLPVALSAKTPPANAPPAKTPMVTLASDQMRSRRGPAEAAVELAAGTLQPTRRPGTAEDLECPDADLRPLVARIERHDGVLVWVLHDGRRFRRNPKVAVGEPLLVPFVAIAADDHPE